MTEVHQSNEAARPNTFAMLSEAARAYYEELHNAWVALNNSAREAQTELSKKVAAVHMSAASANAHDRFARAQRVCADTQQAIHAGGSQEMWHHFKRAQDEYFDAAKELAKLREETQGRVEAAHREHADALRDASTEVRKRYDAAFRTYLMAQQAAWVDLDVNTVDPAELIEMGRSLVQIGANAQFNLAKQP